MNIIPICDQFNCINSGTFCHPKRCNEANECVEISNLCNNHILMCKNVRCDESHGCIYEDIACPYAGTGNESFCDLLLNQCVVREKCKSDNPCLVTSYLIANDSCSETTRIPNCCTENSDCPSETCVKNGLLDVVGQCQDILVGGGGLCERQDDGTTCTDSNNCTINDRCVSGICRGTLDPRFNQSSCYIPTVTAKK
jgi:hypothetical protein